MGHTATPEAHSSGLTATEHRLANGLRVVLSEDHLTPVAAVCLWYDVGSRHEVQGRTGLAHLFEHLMFQGSRSVKGNGHFELVQGARRFAQRHHELRAHQLLRDDARPPGRAGPVAGGRPDGQPARRARPGEPGQPARRGQERAPPALRQRALRHGLRAAHRAGLPRGPPVPPHRRSARWPTWTRPRWRTRGRSSVRTTRPATRCWPWSATSTPRRRWPGSRSTSAVSPPMTASPPRATARCPT